MNNAKKIPMIEVTPTAYKGNRNFAHVAGTVFVSITEGMIAWAVSSDGPAINANPRASHRNFSAFPTSAHSAVDSGLGSIRY